MKPRFRFWASPLVAIVSLLISASAFADSVEVQMSNERSPHALQLDLETGYAIIDRAGSSLDSLTLGIGANWAFSRRWSVGGDVSLGLSPTSGFVTYFSEFNLGVTYALTGSDLLRSEDTLRVNGKATVVTRSLSQGGLRTELLLSQYFLNSQTASYPFSGFGLLAYYEFPTTSSYNWRLGARVETISNGIVSLVPVRIVLGLLFNP